jgi:hypothetical protein
MVVLVGSSQVFMAVESKGLPVEDDPAALNPLEKRRGALWVPKLLLK